MALCYLELTPHYYWIRSDCLHALVDLKPHLCQCPCNMQYGQHQGHPEPATGSFICLCCCSNRCKTDSRQKELRSRDCDLPRYKRLL